MRHIIEEKFLQLVRFYTFHTPIRKGKYRLYQTALKLCKTPHRSLSATLKDGRRFSINLTTGMQESVYFVGELERVLTEIALKLMAEGDTCIDVGANFGWYTSLMALKGGQPGFVHAFEPTPQSFAELKRNYELMGSPANVFINQVALADHAGSVQIHFFEGLGTGHASLAAKENATASTVDCLMITLDSYLEEKNISRVNFVKVDIEGAELLFLKGATKLFAQVVPPVILMEMATGQSENFGYHPNDLIEFIRSSADYEFFAIDEYEGTARSIERFEEGDIGANVFCIPRSLDDKRAVLREYLI